MIDKKVKSKLKRLTMLRRKAGERVMVYDDCLAEEFEKIGIDLGQYEGGLNSVFLITEPSYCERVILDIIADLERNNENAE